jgi:hypothetical protein
MAQEFGDHPETAVARMRWARQIVAKTFEAARPGSPTSATDGCRLTVRASPTAAGRGVAPALLPAVAGMGRQSGWAAS